VEGPSHAATRMFHDVAVIPGYPGTPGMSSAGVASAAGVRCGRSYDVEDPSHLAARMLHDVAGVTGCPGTPDGTHAAPHAQPYRR
jgi:hypothetical protein